MNDKAWLSQYFGRYQKLTFRRDIFPSLVALADKIAEARAKRRKLIFVGNGGSATIASHCALDFSRIAKVRSITFNAADLITCLSNDYGYAHWVQKALELYADPGDVLVLVSSSGKSPNMLNAAKYARKNGISLATFTGFSSQNPLRRLGDINFWADSDLYNIIENTHLVWLLSVCDMLAQQTRD